MQSAHGALFLSPLMETEHQHLILAKAQKQGCHSGEMAFSKKQLKLNFFSMVFFLQFESYLFGFYHLGICFCRVLWRL